MDFLSSFPSSLADGRLGTNLIAIHGIITLAVLVSLLLRRLIAHSGSLIGKGVRPPGITGSDPFSGARLSWLESAGEEAARHALRILSWLTTGVVLLAVVGGMAYHLAGRDIRLDVSAWYESLTIGELFQIGLACGVLILLVVGTRLGVRAVGRIWPLFEALAIRRITGPGLEEVGHRWFWLLHVYVVIAIRMLAAYFACRVVGLEWIAENVVAFLLQILTIGVIACLLTLSCRFLFEALAECGERYLGKGPFHHYWERVRRLFPFGERCFEAAVYVSAASMIIQQLGFITTVAEAGPKIVKCIGIFFVTRVLIELLQVLLNEGFGLNEEEERPDQKGRTLVPLLCSIGQYVLYFGAGLFMLQAFDINPMPILAGASIIGLAVGLGAQSLVTDVVSGFFILFENQFLVGDHVQIGDACGIVEAVGIRVTQIRDGQGKVYIIPNGQIKGIVSYSKGYVNAQVDLRVPSGRDLEGIFRAMAEAGRRLKQAHQEVLADTHIQGLVEFGTSEMTVRAVTKVKPGTHARMQNEYRRLLKQVLDENAAGNQAALAA